MAPSDTVTANPATSDRAALKPRTTNRHADARPRGIDLRSISIRHHRDATRSDVREQDVREQDVREQDVREQDVREQDVREQDVVAEQSRLLDLALASMMSIAFAPIIIAVALLVRLSSRGPVIYRQVRVGLGGRRFEMLKFRSMVPDADSAIEQILASDPEFASEYEEDCKLRLDPRVSRIGRILRPSGLDELPQLLNVLRGEMSLVGPRPVREFELKRYGAAARTVLGVRPGLTGAWQISGRNETGYDERVAFDLEYARRRSVSGDLALFFRTAVLLVTGRLSGGY